jgi:hypothetical protein
MPDTITASTRIALPCGWEMTFDTRDNGSLQAFVNKGRRGASLNFARETGTDSSDDEPIPAQVMRVIERTEYDEYE